LLITTPTRLVLFYYGSQLS